MIKADCENQHSVNGVFHGGGKQRFGLRIGSSEDVSGAVGEKNSLVVAEDDVHIAETQGADMNHKSLPGE